MVNPFCTPQQQSDSGRLIDLPNPLDIFFLCLQTFAAFPCINGGIFHHQKASRAEANGINSSAACQEHMPAREHREEGQRDTGSRWGQSSSITPCQQQPRPVGASWFRLVFPHPYLALLAFTLRHCVLPAIPPRFPLFSCNISLAGLFAGPGVCLLPHLPLAHEYFAWEPGFGPVGASRASRSIRVTDLGLQWAGAERRKKSGCLAKKTHLCNCLSAREKKYLHFSVGNQEMAPCCCCLCGSAEAAACEEV